jgi:predicted ATP-dependent Lon-type protease
LTCALNAASSAAINSLCVGILASSVNENHMAFAGSTEIGPLIRKIAILNV